MALSNQEVSERLEALQHRDAEFGERAEFEADSYRQEAEVTVQPYKFPFQPPFEEFYQPFIYENPHHVFRQRKSLTTVIRSGNFLVFVPKHCVISSSLPQVLEQVGNSDFAYGDSFHFDPEDSSQFTHQLRPGWSPERLRGHCYVGDVVIATKKLVKRAGGRRFLASLTSHDRALRLSEIADSPMHLSALLYGTPIQCRIPSVDVEAVKSHCVRVGINAQVSLFANGRAVQVLRYRKDSPSVCAIIPTRGTSAEVFGNHIVMAAHALQSLRKSATSINLEIIVVFDTATPQDALEEMKIAAGDGAKFIPYDKPFNFAEKTNIAAVNTDADYLLFMNDDTEIITPDIMNVMLSYFEDKTIGMVGPMLKYEDGTIQSAGHLLNPIPYDLYRGCELREDAGFGLLNVGREVSSVIAAFSMTPRDVFEQVGGLSQLFPADYQDIDYALKLAMIGYRTIFTPFAECFHFESKTRIPGEKPESVALLGKRWQHIVEHDPYGNDCLEPRQSIWKSNHDSEWSRREAMGADTVTL